jgi:uncharacterized integral membrane protein
VDTGREWEGGLQVLRVFFWIIGIPLLLAVVTFAVNNHDPVALDLWPVAGDAVAFPLFAVALVALMFGFGLGVAVAWLNSSRGRKRVRDLVRQLESDQREMAVLREQVNKTEPGGAAAAASERLPAVS